MATLVNRDMDGFRVASTERAMKERVKPATPYNSNRDFPLDKVRSSIVVTNSALYVT